MYGSMLSAVTVHEKGRYAVQFLSLSLVYTCTFTFLPDAFFRKSFQSSMSNCMQLSFDVAEILLSCSSSGKEVPFSKEAMTSTCSTFLSRTKKLSGAMLTGIVMSV